MHVPPVRSAVRRACVTWRLHLRSERCLGAVEEIRRPKGSSVVILRTRFGWRRARGTEDVLSQGLAFDDAPLVDLVLEDPELLSGELLRLARLASGPGGDFDHADRLTKTERSHGDRVLDDAIRDEFRLQEAP